MTPKIRIRRRHHFAPQRKNHSSKNSGKLGVVITTLLLAVVLCAGPLILGGTRSSIQFPLLGLVALLFGVQGLRLARSVPSDARRQVDAIDWAVVLFVFYALARGLTSLEGSPGRIEIMEVIACAGVFWTCRYGMTDRKCCLTLLYLLVALGLGETAFGYYWSNHPDWLPFGSAERWQPYAPRWVGTYGNPNHYAGLLVMAVGTALALGSLSKLAWPMRIVFYYVAVIMMIGVMCSGSRGSWIALVASIFALVTLGIRNGTMRWWVPVTGALVLLVVTCLLFSLSPLVRERWAAAGTEIFSGQLETDLHNQLAGDAFRTVHDHPFFGTGPGRFVFINSSDHDQAFVSETGQTHDDYLDGLDDYGLVGFFLVSFFMGAVTLKFLRPLVVDHRWQDRVVVATGFAAWLAMLIHSLADFNLHIPANALLLFSLTGLGLGRIIGEKDQHWSTFSLIPLGRWLGWILVLSSVIYGIEVARIALIR